jgi:hypothetical protein
MPGAVKSDVKLGFWLGAGLFLFALTLVITQYLVKRARGAQAA